MARWSCSHGDSCQVRCFQDGDFQCDNRPGHSLATRKFLGVSEISRSGALKKVWDHIKANNLKDALNKKVICCDEKLKSISVSWKSQSYCPTISLRDLHVY